MTIRTCACACHPKRGEQSSPADANTSSVELPLRVRLPMVHSPSPQPTPQGPIVPQVASVESGIKVEPSSPETDSSSPQPLLQALKVLANKYAWFRTAPQPPISLPLLYPHEIARHIETWEQCRQRRIEQTLALLALKEPDIMHWTEMHRENYEVLLHYYRHVATDFAPGRKLWVKDGCIYYQEPSYDGPRVLWENQVQYRQPRQCVASDAFIRGWERGMDRSDRI